MAAPRSVIVAVLATAALAGCEDDFGDPVSTGAVTGRVVLGGTQTDATGNAELERVVIDATGVRVFLRHADGTTLSTSTEAGRFRFTGVTHGTWRAHTYVIPSQIVESAPVVVAGAESEIADALILASSDTLLTYPSPFTTANGVGLEVAGGPGGLVTFEAMTLDLERVWSGSTTAAPGLFHVHWGGPQVEVVPPGMYWLHLRDANGDYTDLVFKLD